MDRTVVVAIIGGVCALAGTLGTAWLAHRKGKAQRAAERDHMAASATATVTATMTAAYGELIDDLRAQVTAAAGEARSSRDASREALRQAQAAEENAWRAEQAMRTMQRFLTELRPLIETYVPDSGAWLDRLDRLAGLAGSPKPTSTP